ncbi:MAG: hypothetical protein JWN24_1162 [Phycisphaerales bacterium]|nr:hypothetical protein [Phycisphaerales bacterium]
MTVNGRNSVFQRACRSWANQTRRVLKRASDNRRTCLLLSAAFGAVLASGSAVCASPTLTTLAAFDNYGNGAYPKAGVIADAAGNLYGTAELGGANGYGVVFEVAAGTHALSTLATFNGSNGAYPEGGLIADAAGNLYGTTQYGGVHNDGTVFELTETGFVSPTPEPGGALLTGLSAIGILARRRHPVSVCRDNASRE